MAAVKKSSTRKPKRPARATKTRSGNGRGKTTLLVATRKGAWIFHGDGARANWRSDGPHFLGQIVNHLVLDPRDGKTLLAATSTGHLGPTLHRSADMGRTWQEAAQPPAFAKAPEGQSGRSVKHTFWLTPGHANEPNVWYAGTSPQGIFRSEDGGNRWVRIGRNMPARVGDIGFPMVVHPRNDKVVWVFPMDGQTVWPRTSPEGKPSVYQTRNAGKTWKRLDKGLPESGAWWTVKRQAMTADRNDPVGLYFGTTSGDLWMSRDEGECWTSIARHIPEIYAVETATPA